jgi:hypothetical protein
VDNEYKQCNITKRQTIKCISNSLQCIRKKRLQCHVQQTAIFPVQNIELVDFNTKHEVHQYVHDILCSEAWSQSHIIENEKFNCKMKSCVTKYIRMYKITNPGLLPIIPNIISCMNSFIHGCRSPIDHTDYTLSMRETITNRCVDAICKHLCFLTNACSARISKTKLQQLCVGLLYILKKGISMHGIVILPTISILNIILPPEGSYYAHIETCLSIHFFL